MFACSKRVRQPVEYSTSRKFRPARDLNIPVDYIEVIETSESDDSDKENDSNTETAPDNSVSDLSHRFSCDFFQLIEVMLSC